MGKSGGNKASLLTIISSQILFRFPSGEAKLKDQTKHKEGSSMAATSISVQPEDLQIMKQDLSNLFENFEEGTLEKVSDRLQPLVNQLDKIEEKTTRPRLRSHGSHRLLWQWSTTEHTAVCKCGPDVDGHFCKGMLLGQSLWPFKWLEQQSQITLRGKVLPFWSGPFLLCCGPRLPPRYASLGWSEAAVRPVQMGSLITSQIT